MKPIKPEQMYLGLAILACAVIDALTDVLPSWTAYAFAVFGILLVLLAFMPAERKR